MSCQEIEDLQSNHEEADIRTIIDAAYANKDTDCIVVYSLDTDVLLLLNHHMAAIGLGEMYTSTGRTGIHTESLHVLHVLLIFTVAAEFQH